MEKGDLRVKIWEIEGFDYYFDCYDPEGTEVKKHLKSYQQHAFDALVRDYRESKRRLEDFLSDRGLGEPEYGEQEEETE